MMRTIKKMARPAVYGFAKWYCQQICKYEFELQCFNYINERPIEFRFVFKQLLKVCPTRVLDVGVGTTALPYLIRYYGFVVTATDNVRDY